MISISSDPGKESLKSVLHEWNSGGRIIQTVPNPKPKEIVCSEVFKASRHMWMDLRMSSIRAFTLTVPVAIGSRRLNLRSSW